MFLEPYTVEGVVVTHSQMFLNKDSHDFLKVATRHSNDMSFLELSIVPPAGVAIKQRIVYPTA